MHRSARRIAGTALLGLGAAAVTVGSIAGAFAIHKRHESDALCRFGRCSAEGVAENDQAQLAGNASTGAFIGAGVSIGVGLTLLLTALEPSDRAARVGSGPSCAEGARWCAGTTILVPF